MKKKNNFWKWGKLPAILLALSSLGFAACQQEDDFAPQEQEIRVAFTTDAIQTRVNTLATGDVWDNGDQIKIEKTVGYDDTDYCTYTASVDENGTTTWTPDKKLYWNGEEKHILKAFYPTVGQDSYDKFKLPLYQDTEERLKSADCMNAVWVGYPMTNEITFQMKHRLSMVTVNYELASEFTGASISLTIVEAANREVYFDPFTSEGALEVPGIDFDGSPDIWAYNNTVNKTLQAIVLPCTYPKGQLFMTIIINEERLQVKMPEDMTFEEGTHYTFNLKVGKDIVTLTPTTTDTDFPGGWNNDSEVDLK